MDSMAKVGGRLPTRLSVLDNLDSNHDDRPTQEAMINHNKDLINKPGRGLAHAMMQTSSSISRQVCLVNHNHGMPMAHYIAAKIPGSHFDNAAFSPMQVNGATMNAVIVNPGSVMTVARPNLGQGLYTGSLAAGVGFNFSFNGTPIGAFSPSHGFDLRAKLIDNGISGNPRLARQTGPISPVNMQIDLVPGNCVQFATDRYADVSSTFSARRNRQILPKRSVAISTYLDDFKNGFPLHGLSIASNHWWGGGESEKILEESNGGKASLYKSKGKEIKEALQSYGKIIKVSKMVTTSCKRALKLGVARGYDMQNLGHKEVAILKFAFGEFMPKQWTAALPRVN